MEFKEKLISSYLAFEDGLDLTDTVHETRARALRVFEDKGFPTKKDELWKYTSLEALIREDYSLFPKSEVNIAFSISGIRFLSHGEITNDLPSSILIFEV